MISGREKIFNDQSKKRVALNYRNRKRKNVSPWGMRGVYEARSRLIRFHLYIYVVRLIRFHSITN
jgi:hypothetical protein